MRNLLLGARIRGIAAVGIAQSSLEPQYLAETSHAMDRMMADMNAAMTGDVDAKFVGTMVPHHRGAGDMVRAELKYGRNETLRRIAQGIVVARLQEIEAMQLALGATPKASAVPVGHPMPTMPPPQGPS